MRRIIAGLSAFALLTLVAPALLAPSAQAGPARSGAAARPQAVVAKLVLTPATKKVAYGTGWQLKATARSSTGAATNVSSKARWRSARVGLARVSAAGLVTATKRKAAGKVTIRASYGGKVAAAKIVVSSARLRSITGIPASTTLAVGQAFTLQPVGRFVGFSQALRQWSTYATTPTGIVSVSAGTVTALAPGTAVVRTTFRGKAVSTLVTVTAPVPPTPTTPPPPHPQLTFAKSAGPVVDGDGNGLDAGDEITYSFVLTNSGDVPLAVQSVSDPLLGAITCTPASLAVGAAAACSPVTYPLTQADVDAGTLASTATASAQTLSGAPVSATSHTSTVLEVVSRLALDATAGTFTDGDGDSILDMGDVLPWIFTVTNTGGTTLSAVSVTPTADGPAVCPPGTLAPGASFTCSAEHTVTLADVASGGVSTQAEASATGPAGRVDGPAPVATMKQFDRMNVALEHGLPNLVAYDELVAKAQALKAGHVSLAQSLVPATAMTWNPGGSWSKAVTGLAAPYQQVLLRSNYNYKGGSSVADLAIAGTAPGSGTPMAYVASDPFANVAGSSSSAPETPMADPGMNQFNVNLLQWLLKASDLSTSTANVVLANVLGTTTSRSEGATRSWFATHAPGLTLNTTECTLPSTTCLAGADLVIFGGEGSDANAPTIANQVKAVYDAGVPVLTFSDGWSHNAPDAIMATFGTTIYYSPTYWDGNGLQNSTRDTQLPGGFDRFQQVVNPLVSTTFGTPLATSDYSACLGKDTLVGCQVGNAAFSAYRDATESWRSWITGANNSGASWFTQPRTGDQDLMRALVMLADKLRTGVAPSLRPGDSVPTVTYPVPTYTDGAAATRAMFTDATTMTSWSGNQASAQTGTLYCTRAKLVANTCTAPGWPGFGDHSLTLKATQNDEWQATGLDAKPGVPVTVSLTSDPGVKVWVRTFFQRNATTKSGQVDGSNRSHYDRPQLPATDWIPVTTAGTTFSTPYGGPLYVRIGGSAATNGTAVPLAFEDTATHPTVLDMTDDAQIAAFMANIDNGAYYADLAGNGFQAHAPVVRIKDSLSDSGTFGRSWTYTAHGGLQQFLIDFRDNFVFNIYKLAGIQIGTKALATTLDPDVLTACRNLGFPCEDSALNQRTVIQHINFDVHSQCGNLCSGNPIDADGGIQPSGWGLSHELGHNLQRKQLNVMWADTGANGSNAAAANVWSNYANRSGEVSNNLFPYHTAWDFYRNIHPGWGLSPEGGVDTGDLSRDTGGVDAFSIAQSIRSAQLTGGHLAAYDASCVSHTTDAATTPVNIAIANAIWRKSGTYDDNNLRMSFYQQIPVLLRGQTLSDGTVLRDGFGIWTLLYQAARGWSDATSSSAKWTAAAQATYGMSNFAWTNDAVYGTGNDVGDMIGNDFLLIELSKITGYDWRPYFETHGVLYTAQADQQVTTNTPTGGYKSFNNVYPALGSQLPFQDMSNIASVDMTLPITGWPGAYESSVTTKSKVNFHPVVNCPVVP